MIRTIILSAVVWSIVHGCNIQEDGKSALKRQKASRNLLALLRPVVQRPPLPHAPKRPVPQIDKQSDDTLIFPMDE